MSNSGLATYVNISPYRTSPRNHVIDTVTIHCMAGQLTAAACGEWFQSSNCSSNYGVGKDGSIGLYVEECDRSWCSSNSPNDHRAITIEVASDSTDPYKVTDEAYESLIKLLVDICQRNNIGQLRWKADPNLIGQVDLQNMTVHRWFKKKACPGDYLFNKHLEIANEVNSKMGAPLIPPLADVSSDQTSASVQDTYTGRFEDQATTLTSPNSKLITYSNRTGARNCSARSGAITAITVHIAKKRGDINVLATMINSGSSSYNYGIDTEGTIGLFVDEPLRSNASENEANDDRAINIVCMNSTLAPDYKISTATYNALVELCADICRRNYIAQFTYTRKPKKDSLTLHNQFNSQANCPGPYFTSILNKFVKDVNEQLARVWSKSNARIAMTSEAAAYVQSGINLDAIHPYIASPSKGQLGVNYNELRNIGVVGIMLDAGMRYNKKHELVDFKPSALYKQCEEVKESKLPFGFYYTTHAQTIDQVKEEAYQLYFIVSKYPPKLGIWLHCQFDVAKARALALVDEYYSIFVQWGFKSKCGLYATKEQAELINWPRQCTYMPLWLEGEMTNSVAPEDEILTPSFFKLDDLSNKGVKKDQVINDPYPEEGAIGQYYTSTFTNGVQIETVTEEVYSKYTLKTIPPAPYYTGMKKWESYKAITSQTSRQWKITRDPSCITDNEGFRRMEGYWLVAVGTGITGTVGTYVDVILENKMVIPCIAGDIKSDVHTDPGTGHVYTSVNTNWCCSEFIVDPSSLNEMVKKTGDCSYLMDAWKSPVVEFKVYTKNWFDTYSEEEL